MYALTTIFRTETGICPAYTLVGHTPGRYDFDKPVLLISNDNVHAVTHAVVTPVLPGVVLTGRQGFVAVGEEYYKSLKLLSISNFPLHMVEPRRSVPDEDIPARALDAGIALSGFQAVFVNRVVTKLRFLEIRTKPYTAAEYDACFDTAVNFRMLTAKQTYSWMYHLLVVLFRCKKVRVSNESGNQYVRIYLSHVFWRDIFIMLLKHLNADFFVKYEPKKTVVTFLKHDFRRMLARLLSNKFTRVVNDFAFIDSVSPKKSIILDTEGMVVVSDRVDNPAGLCVMRTQFRATAFSGCLVMFPELTGLIEANGFLLGGD